jgi:hypothetical protein
VVVVVSLRCNRASQCRAHEKYGQISMHVVFTPACMLAGLMSVS